LAVRRLGPVHRHAAGTASTPFRPYGTGQRPAGRGHMLWVVTCERTGELGPAMPGMGVAPSA
jgi:hypothetical protein